MLGTIGPWVGEGGARAERERTSSIVLPSTSGCLVERCFSMNLSALKSLRHSRQRNLVSSSCLILPAQIWWSTLRGWISSRSRI